MKSKKLLIPLPRKDFDPSDTAIPWHSFYHAGLEITFATPNGEVAKADEIMLTGKRLGFLAPILMANQLAKNCYEQMINNAEFRNPISWDEIGPDYYDGIFITGGHAKGMREFLESSVLQRTISEFFKLRKPVATICHGVVLVARSRAVGSDKSVLYDRKTTGLLAYQEMSAWALTALWMGRYYRTYTKTVEAEVKENLRNPRQFLPGPIPLFRDSPTNIKDGFVVIDGNYVSARWPGDAHRLAKTFLEILI